MNGREFPPFGSALDRRAFLRLGVGTAALGWAAPSSLARMSRTSPARTAAVPRGSARACVFIFLRGGPSHIDTLDIKTGPWTPERIGVALNASGYEWPMGTMPRLGARSEMFSIVRTVVHQEVAHERAEYFLETGRRLNPGLRGEIPNLGALIAYDFEQSGRRPPTATFPGFVEIGGTPWTDQGFLSQRYAPFSQQDAGQINHPGGPGEFDRRSALLDLVNAAAAAPADGTRQPLPIFQEQAAALMRDPITPTAFFPDSSSPDWERYGGQEQFNSIGHKLLTARNVLEADRGTNFIVVDQYGWDHHVDIFDPDPNNYQSFYNLSVGLDVALSAFLDDLSSTPGVEPGKSLLDETLVVAIGEFGRTVEALNPQNGRDHWPDAFPGLLAGGGVRGGRVIGSTDAKGAYVRERGWSHDRDIHVTDLVATIHSALGIDWTQGLYDTPSGRVYWYVDHRAIGDSEAFEIAPLFE
jgi:hypothetical protein